MNESLVFLCWICGALVPESEADAHCAEHAEETEAARKAAEDGPDGDDGRDFTPPYEP